MVNRTLERLRALQSSSACAMYNPTVSGAPHMRDCKADISTMPACAALWPMRIAQLRFRMGGIILRTLKPTGLKFSHPALTALRRDSVRVYSKMEKDRCEMAVRSCQMSRAGRRAPRRTHTGTTTGRALRHTGKKTPGEPGHTRESGHSGQSDKFKLLHINNRQPITGSLS